MFGFQEGDAPAADPQREQAAALTQGTEELEAAVREIQEMKLPTVPVHTVRNEEEPAPPAQEEETRAQEPEQPAQSPEEKPLTEEPEALDDVAALTQEFVQKQEENKRREATPGEQFQYQAADPQNAYVFPPVTMLAESPQGNPAAETEELQTNGRVLVDTLKSFGVQTKILDICRGPAVTRYEIQPAAGVKISKITNLSDDLALNLAATGRAHRGAHPREGRGGHRGAQQEAQHRADAGPDPVQRLPDFQEQAHRGPGPGYRRAARGGGPGQDAPPAHRRHHRIGQVRVHQLPDPEHALQGTPEEVRFLMIDPKAVELTEYNGMPHMLVPVVTDPHKASGALGWAVSEMMKRYKIFSEYNVRNLKGYNSLAEAQGFQDENGPAPCPPCPRSSSSSTSWRT